MPKGTGLKGKNIKLKENILKSGDHMENLLLNI